MNENSHSVRIIEVLLRAEGESPGEFKQRIADAQLSSLPSDFPPGFVHRTTITPEGLKAELKWGQAWVELPSDTCVVAWASPSVARSKFLVVEPKVLEQALRRAQIATQYAAEMRRAYGGAHSGIPGDIHYRFADAILAKQAYRLEYLSNGLNGAAKAAFTAVTGVVLPKQHAATWKAIREWAGVSDAAYAVAKAQRKVSAELTALRSQVDNVQQTQDWIRQRISEGFNRLVNEPGRWILANAQGRGYDLSRKGAGLSKARMLISAEIALAQAQAAQASEHAGPAEEALAHSDGPLPPAHPYAFAFESAQAA